MTMSNRFDEITRSLASPLPLGRTLRLSYGLLGAGVVNAMWPARARIPVGATAHEQSVVLGSFCGNPFEVKNRGDANNYDQSFPNAADFEKPEPSSHLAQAIAERRKLFVHAGVVGWRGKAIVIPGRSMTGKSEMVAALVRAGASYYYDEYAVFDKDGYVHPYAKPLTLRRGHDGRQRQSPVEVSRDLLGSKRLPVGLIVVGPYHSGAQWNPRMLTPGEAVLEMLDNTVLARSKSLSGKVSVD